MGRLVKYLKLRSPLLILFIAITFILFLTTIHQVCYYCPINFGYAMIILKRNYYIFITIIFLSIYFYISRKKEQEFMKSLNFNVIKIQAKLVIFHVSILLVSAFIYTIAVKGIMLISNINLNHLSIEGDDLLVGTLLLYYGLSLFQIKAKFKQISSLILILGLCYLISLMGVKYSLYSYMVTIILLLNNIVKNFKSGGNYV